MSTFRGEVINQTAPSITVTGSTSGSFTVNGADTPFNINTGVDSSTVTKVDTGRVIKYDEALPTIVGTATVTITAASGTEVHFSLNGRNPTAHAAHRNVSTEKYHCQGSYIYTGAFTMPANRPGKHHNAVLRVRAYKVNAHGKYGVSPNEKSKLMIIKFNIKH
jgi:hypothetical protein